MSASSIRAKPNRLLYETSAEAAHIVLMKALKGTSIHGIASRGGVTEGKGCRVRKPESIAQDCSSCRTALHK